MTKSCGRRKFTWFEGHAELVRRVPLIDREAYDHEKAYELLPATKTIKPLLRCKLYCLTDGIKVKKASRFGQNAPRKFYPYKDIHRFYAFADHADTLILGCADPEKDSKMYEFFKLDENHVQELCQLIERAHRDPMYRLVENEGGPQRYQSSQSSLTGDTDTVQDETEVPKVNSDAVVLQSTEPLELEEANAIDEVDMSLLPPEECVIEPEKVNHEQQAAPVEEPQSVFDKVPEHTRRNSLFQRLCANLDERELLAVDMIYIEHDGKQGNQIADGGATYVFVAHHKHPDHYHHENELNGTEECAECQVENTAEPCFSTFTPVHANS